MQREIFVPQPFGTTLQLFPSYKTSCVGCDQASMWDAPYINSVYYTVHICESPYTHCWCN